MHNKFLPKRRSIRWHNYSYTRSASYFITISTKDKKPTLGYYAADSVVLTQLGLITDACLKSIQQHHPNVIRVLYSIQPNHIHVLITIIELPDNSEEPEQFGKPVRGSIPTIVRTLKAAITREIRRRFSNPNLLVFHRGYYMRVLFKPEYVHRVEGYITFNTQIHLARRRRRSSRINRK
jgi:REP element-mobilizing transposase RayT